MTLTVADLDRIEAEANRSRGYVQQDDPYVVIDLADVDLLTYEIRRLRAALHQIDRVEPGLAALPEVARRVLDETGTE